MGCKGIDVEAEAAGSCDILDRGETNSARISRHKLKDLMEFSMEMKGLGVLVVDRT